MFFMIWLIISGFIVVLIDIVWLIPEKIKDITIGQLACWILGFPILSVLGISYLIFWLLGKGIINAYNLLKPIFTKKVFKK